MPKQDKYSKTGQKYYDIAKSGKISESELISLRSFLSSDKATREERNDIRGALADAPGGMKLTKDQQKKGIDWLISQYKTPAGKLKANTPFGYREVHVLENWDEVTLKDLYDSSRFGMNPYYLPLFEVSTKTGDSFEYYVNGGKINIVG